VLLPEIQVTLIESQNKKATFLREVIRKLGLSGASVYLGRAETWDRQADVVTMRAVEHFEKVLPTAASLVRHAGANSALERPNSQQAGSKDGGRLALLIGANQSGQAIEILPDFHWQNPITVPNSESRVVLIGRRD
jgi:16S rRNA G527 N7-methylase RsmG